MSHHVNKQLSSRSVKQVMDVDSQYSRPLGTHHPSYMLNHKDALAKQIMKRISSFHNRWADEKTWVRCKQQKLNKAYISKPCQEQINEK